ncbi:MAG TPA: hydroxyisourate hydrolase [Myxococcales bacterium]|jgi:5-hydroxyisourate hydrolase|nr:hydroxyisourate hydrolase [Myxococcales bacterium]
MSAITTHVLDTSKGRPAAGVRVTLEVKTDGGWTRLGGGATDADGRLRTLLAAGSPIAAGTYRLTFETAAYFAAQGVTAFYPEVQVQFAVQEGGGHFHVPLLLSPYGYSTYRGS